MKDPAGNAARWLQQAEYDLHQARELLGRGVFSYAAFFSEQASQKALKAFLFARGRRSVTIHSVGELARTASDIDPRFAEFVNRGSRLDRHYLASRYPDALPPPAIPARSYSREDAEEAVATASAIVAAVEAAIG